MRYEVFIKMKILTIVFWAVGHNTTTYCHNPEDHNMNLLCLDYVSTQIRDAKCKYG
jgi:hypothetical protein